jgi:hypothetical protein
MPESPRIGQNPLPESLHVRNLAAELDEVRTDCVARGRRKAAARTFDDREVVQEIASQLLLLSGDGR